MFSSITSPQIGDETTSASGSERKKRNKLGYRRTAVACGHCRHRKTRCIPLADQTESRCQNCIRLKKECQFYSVDGEGANTRKSKSELRAEPSVDERHVSKDSPSLDPVKSTQDPYDTASIRDVASNAVQTHTHGLMASPTSDVGAKHIQEHPDRSVQSTQVYMQNLYYPQRNQTPSAPVQAYWSANDPAQLIYQQQQFSVANASALPPQDPQLQHSNQDIGSLRGAPPSFGSMPTPDMSQSPSTYQQYGNTFPKMQRTMTIPAVQSQLSRDRANMGIQVSPQVGAGHAHGQYAYNQVFPSQFTHGAHWYAPPNAQQAFAPHYLPSQRDHSCDQPDWPG